MSDVTRQVGGALGVAVFGALIASTDTATVLQGIGTALIISTGLLLAGTMLAWLYIAQQASTLPRAAAK